MMWFGKNQSAQLQKDIISPMLDYAKSAYVKTFRFLKGVTGPKLDLGIKSGRKNCQNIPEKIRLNYP